MCLNISWEYFHFIQNELKEYSEEIMVRDSWESFIYNCVFSPSLKLLQLVWNLRQHQGLSSVLAVTLMWMQQPVPNPK